MTALAENGTGLPAPKRLVRQSEPMPLRRTAEMMDDAEKRGHLIRHLEEALTLADEIQDGQTGYLIERALDEARARQFRPIG